MKNLKVGDVVRVKKDLTVGEYYGGDVFVDEMSKLSGKTSIITNVGPFGGYKLKDGLDYNYTTEMLEPVNNDFKKSDLKNGDVIERRNGDIEIVIVETGTLVRKEGYNALRSLTNDLKDNDGVSDWDVISVRRPQKSVDCRFTAFEHNSGKVIYNRCTVMTQQELIDLAEKTLGEKVEIVK